MTFSPIHIQSITEEYTVNSDGHITNPGKFECEAAWVPHFWNAGLDGLACFEFPNGYGFLVQAREAKQWTGLANHIGEYVYLIEEDDGFVWGTILPESEFLSTYHSEVVS